MPDKGRPFSVRFAKFAAKAGACFIMGSAGIVLIYKFVPVPITITQAVDSNGAKRDWTSLDNISPNMVRAVIAAEDGKFCSHYGFDQDAITAAMKRNAKGERLRGGSTISQQTAKNVFLW